MKPSLQFASYKKHVKSLEEEFKLRKRESIPVNWLDEKDIIEKFGFRAPAGILSKDGAQVDAYSFTHALLQKSKSFGLRIYDHTEVVKINYNGKGIELITESGNIIKSGKLIIACGYESQRYIPKKIEKFYSTYAVVSVPIPLIKFWYNNSLIWENAMPYLYMRTTGDHRILIIGKDDAFSDSLKRNAALPQKAQALEKSFKRLFPHIPFKTDFQWAGVFAAIRDGLPYIGSIPERPHTYFALRFGGNGVTFSMIAAQLLRDIFCSVKNPDLPIFSFAR